MSSTDVAERSLTGTVVDDVIARGDLKGLTPEQRVVHYNNVCRSLGLNPLTQPFQYVTLNGALRLYAKRDATDQLRKINSIDIKVVDRVVNDGLLTVHVRATDKNGRNDEDFGVVSIIGLKGEAAANAMMKAVTKAKRRVTLSISGLGFADESEIEGMIGETQPFSNLAGNTNQRTMVGNTPHPSQSQDERSTAIDEQQRLAALAREKVEQSAKEPCEIGIDHDADLAAWSTWATILLGFIRAAPDADTINEWTLRNADHLDRLKQFDPGKYTRLVDMINHQIAQRTEQGT